LEEVEDRGKLFVDKDYQNMITYLEDSRNYTALFGDGAKTSVGVKQMTKLQAFEVFATWLNVQNPKLEDFPSLKIPNLNAPIPNSKLCLVVKKGENQ
jgi:hypothetical protein